MTPTISVTDLSRRYRDQAALDNISLTVEPGTVTGLLGRNGAGKTTLASWFYPNWSAELAEQLLADFELPLSRRIRRLSRGMRSAVGIVIGLAARAELTLFDEPYAGLDAVTRQLFYDRLLADFAEHPRTIVLSTHLIDEVADLLDRVVMLDHGLVALDAPAEEIRGTAMTVSGPASAVEEFVAGGRVWHRQRIASRASVVVPGPLDASAQAPAHCT
jgi:ABC-2 type transport system ATP-binding protein